MSDLLPELLKAVSGPVVSTVGGIATAALGRSWSNEDWSRQTRVLNQQAIANAKNSPLYTVEGLKRAGLNPALAAGSYSEAPVQSAPMQQHNIPFSPIDLTQMQLLKANSNLANSQANLNNVEAEDKQIEVNRKKFEDATHEENMHSFFGEKMKQREKEIRAANPKLSESDLSQKVSEDPWYRYYVKMHGRSANAGTTKSFRDFTQLLAEDSESGARIIHAALSRAVDEGQLDPKILDTLVHSPNHNREEQLHRIALMLAQTWAAQTSGDKNYHSDLAAMLKNKDKLGAFVYGGEKVADIISSWSPLMWLKAFRGTEGRKVAKTTEKAFDNLNKI